MLTNYCRCTLPTPDSTSHSGVCWPNGFFSACIYLLIFIIIIHIDRNCPFGMFLYPLSMWI